jgi:hypothetical protein
VFGKLDPSKATQAELRYTDNLPRAFRYPYFNFG